MFKDLTPKPDMTKVQRIDLAELGITLRTSAETLRELERMELEQIRARIAGRNAVFD